MLFYNISHATLGPHLSLDGSEYMPAFKMSPQTAIMRG